MISTGISSSRWMGFLPLIIGGLLFALAGGVLPADPESVNAPNWIIGVAALIFSAAGVAMLFQRKRRLSGAMATIVLLAFAIIGFWIAFEASNEDISGGLPFLPRETNAQIGRWMFGIGAAVCLVISVVALKSVIQNSVESAPD